MSRRIIVFKRAKPPIENQTPAQRMYSCAEWRGNHRERVHIVRKTRVGKCAGELISGVIQMAAGCSGMTTGIGITGTGGGAPAGAIVISASFALAANGYATSAHALDEAQRLWEEGPPPDAPASAPPEKLLKPKTRPKQPATTAPPAQATPAQPAKPVQPAKPAATETRNKKTSEVVKAETTTSPKPAQPQAGAEVKPKGAKRGPKTDPDAPHNAAVRKEADKLAASGNKIIAGGRRAPERLVTTEGGEKSGRRPDTIYVTPDGQRRGLNVGKTKADGTPVKREKEALDDLNKYSDTPTDFAPYDR